MNKEEILKIYKLYRFYIFPAIVGFSSLVLIILIIYPQTTSLINNQKMVGDILNKSQALAAKAQTLENYNQSDLSQKVNLAISAYPTDKNVVSTLGLLQSLTSQSGFSIASIALGGNSSIVQSSANQNYGVKLDLIGPVSLLPTLLTSIETSSRIMRVNDIEVTPGKDQQQTIVTLSVDVLYSDIPQNLGSVDSPLPKLSQKDQDLLDKLSKQTPVQVAQPVISASASAKGKVNPFQ